MQIGVGPVWNWIWIISVDFVVDSFRQMLALLRGEGHWRRENVSEILRRRHRWDAMQPRARQRLHQRNVSGAPAVSNGSCLRGGSPFWGTFLSVKYVFYCVATVYRRNRPPFRCSAHVKQSASDRAVVVWYKPSRRRKCVTQHSSAVVHSNRRSGDISSTRPTVVDNAAVLTCISVPVRGDSRKIRDGVYFWKQEAKLSLG